MHLPGPSLWPFVAPAGLLLIVFAVVFGLASVANMVLLTIGVTIVGIGLLGWYLDANREYAHVEAASHGQLEAGVRRATRPTGPCSRRPGRTCPVPRPGPSWPRSGSVFMVAGLVFGPAMLIGGLVMAAIAAIGWLLDADRELDDVEAHGHPTQADRDPREGLAAPAHPRLRLRGRPGHPADAGAVAALAAAG